MTRLIKRTEIDRLNLLVSRQVYQRPTCAAVVRHFGPRIRLMIDCGAFVDYQKGLEPWTVPRYIAWLQSVLDELDGTGIEIDGYMALDVVGDADATLSNYEQMLDAGYSPIPILTRGASDAHLRRFLDTSGRIALGGIFGGSADQSALRKMVSRLPRGYPQHWLGFSQHDFVSYYRPDSVDTTSWARSTKWGDIFTYMGPGRWTKIKNYAIKITPAQRAAIRRLGFDPAKLLTDNRKNLDNPEPIGDCVSLASYLAFAKDLERYIGTRYFFALAYSGTMSLMLLQTAAGGVCPGVTDANDQRAWMASSPPGIVNVPASRVCHHT